MSGNNVLKNSSSPMADEMPLIVNLNGEGMGHDEYGSPFLQLALYGQWGDWYHGIACEWDFTVLNGRMAYVKYTHGDGRGHWIDHWILGRHYG